MFFICSNCCFVQKQKQKLVPKVLFCKNITFGKSFCSKNRTVEDAGMRTARSSTRSIQMPEDPEANRPRAKERAGRNHLEARMPMAVPSPRPERLHAPFTPEAHAHMGRIASSVTDRPILRSTQLRQRNKPLRLRLKPKQRRPKQRQRQQQRR